MKKITTLLGISTFVIVAACGGGEEPGMDQMDEAEPSSDMMMEDADSAMAEPMMADTMMADTMMADTMMADTMMEEGMPEEMTDEGEGMSDDEMGGGA